MVLTQMSNLFSDMMKLQTRHTEKAVGFISDKVHDIVQNFCIVKDDGSDVIFKALLAVTNSLTGITGTLGATVALPLPLQAQPSASSRHRWDMVRSKHLKRLRLSRASSLLLTAA